MKILSKNQAAARHSLELCATSIVALFALCAAPQALSQPRDLVLAISEGTSGGLDHSRVIAKYGGLTNVLAEAMKRRVVVVFVREFAPHPLIGLGIAVGGIAGRFEERVGDFDRGEPIEKREAAHCTSVLGEHGA